MDPDEDRRIEADDEWLAGHRSDAMLRFQRRFRRVAGIGDAVSNAELGPFGGAPRNPKLHVGGRSYALVRYAQHRIACTTIRVDLHRCRYCGRWVAEIHQVIAVRETGGRVVVGAVRMCRSCQGDSWMFHSRMPSVLRARRRSRNVVL